MSFSYSRILVKIKAEEQHHRTSLILMNVLNGVERINGLPSAMTYVQDDIHPVSVLLVLTSKATQGRLNGHKCINVPQELNSSFCYFSCFGTLSEDTREARSG